MPFFFLHAPELIRIVMTASSSATARLLSLAVLLLSLAPLGSIYVLLLSFDYSGNKAEITENAAQSSSLAQVVRDPNATLEELWTALFLERRNPSFISSPLLFEYLNFKGKSVHHWCLVIPWFFSFFLGVVVPTALSIYSIYRQRMRRGDVAVDRERRSAKMLKKVKLYTKTLVEEDLLVEQTSDSANDKQDDGSNNWKLPLPGVTLLAAAVQVSSGTPLETRSVPGTCAICLNQYAVDDVVIWSPNRDCVHCFHEDCILPWLLRKSSKHRQCPCCRQSFVSSTTKAAPATDAAVVPTSGALVAGQ
jgi:hypothetical protein